MKPLAGSSCDYYNKSILSGVHSDSSQAAEQQNLTLEKLKQIQAEYPKFLVNDIYRVYSYFAALTKLNAHYEQKFNIEPRLQIKPDNKNK